MTFDPAQLSDPGLYDPAAADASRRLELLEFLAGWGRASRIWLPDGPLLTAAAARAEQLAQRSPKTAPRLASASATR